MNYSITMIGIAHNVGSQSVRAAAETYRREGYDVIAYPHEREVPRFLRGLPIDLLARNRQQHIAVSVVAADARERAHWLPKLAKTLQGRSGWRQDVVLVPTALDDDQETVGNSSAANLFSIDRQIREVRSLIKSSHNNAAFVAACSIVEAISRHVLGTQGLAVNGGVGSKLAKTLFAYGLVSMKDYQAMMESLRQRNAIVHGHQLSGVRRVSASRVLALAKRIQGQEQPRRDVVRKSNA